MITQIITYHILFFFCNAVKPACQSFIIMGSCISYGIFRIIVRQVIVGTTGISGVKGKFQYLHTWKTAVINQFAHRVCYIAKIFRNDFLFSQHLTYPVKKIDPRSLFPVASGSIFRSIRDRIILVKSSEMVNAHCIIQFKTVGKPL